MGESTPSSHPHCSMATFDATAAMNGPVPPPPKRRDSRNPGAIKPGRAAAFEMLSVVVAASTPGDAFRSLRQSVAMSIPRTGNQNASNSALWRALLPKDKTMAPGSFPICSNLRRQR